MKPILDGLEARVKQAENELTALRREIEAYRTQGDLHANEVGSTDAPPPTTAQSQPNASPTPAQSQPNASPATAQSQPNASPATADAQPVSPPASSDPKAVFFDNLRRSEFWFNKIGIALLLLGIGFLFKYSVDQGWLIPATRVAIGLVISGLLLTTGWLLRERRTAFAEVLQGGAVAGLYLSGFAAFQWYALWSHPVAFGFMGAVSVLALALSVGQSRVPLALIAVTGALGTPFLLHTDSGNATILLLYAAMVITIATAVFVRYQWWSVHWVSLIGGWGIVLVALSMGDFRALPEQVTLATRMFDLGLPVLAAMAYFALLHGAITLRASGGVQGSVGHLSTTLFLIGFVSGVVVSGVLDLHWRHIGWVWLAVAAFMTLGALVTSWRKEHAIPAVLLFNLGALTLLSDDHSYAFLAAEMALLFMFPRVQGHPTARLVSWIVAGIVLFWTSIRFISDPLIHADTAISLSAFIPDVPGSAEQATSAEVDGAGSLWYWITRVFHPAAVANLLAIGAVFVTGITTVYERSRGYWSSLGHAMVLVWFFRELQQIDAGHAWVTIAWSVWAIAVLVFAIRGRDRFRLITAGVMLLAVVGKLFVIDLAQLETIWRIALFMGFGMLFLILSYRLQSIWERE